MKSGGVMSFIVLYYDVLDYLVFLFNTYAIISLDDGNIYQFGVVTSLEGVVK